MIGCRPLTDEEIKILREHFAEEDEDKFNLRKRNETLIFFSLYTGLRISEVLSLRVGDVYEYGKVNSTVYLQRKKMKGKKAGRTIVLNNECRELLSGYLLHYNRLEPSLPLFFSRKTNASLRRRQAEQIFEDVFTLLAERSNGEFFTGKLSCHTARKTFAQRCYDSLDRNIVDLQAALGHKNVGSTQSYISFDREKVDSALQNLSFGRNKE